MRFKARSTFVSAAAAALVISSAGLALADDISNNLDTSIDATAELMSLNVGGPVGTTTLYVSPVNGDGKNGCNLTGSTQLVIELSSSAESVATVSPSSVTFTACGDTKVLTVTPVAQGSAIISASQTSNTTSGSFNLAPATFTVNVSASAPDPVNTAPTVTVETAPPAKVEGNTLGGAAVTWKVTASDTEDGVIAVSCEEGPASVESGDTFGLGEHTVTCSATDSGALTDSKSFTFTVVDTTAPGLTMPNDIAEKAKSVTGNLVSFDVSADDIVDASPMVTCIDTSNADTPITSPAQLLGTHVISCTATDASGNTSDPKAFTIAVTFDFQGFFAPVDNKVLNGMKSGSTAPIKFRIGDGNGGVLSSLAVVSKASSVSYQCSTGSTVDSLEEYATGGTVLRYDSTANQYIYNWQSPKGKAGSCYTVNIVLADGTPHTASFQLR